MSERKEEAPSCPLCDHLDGLCEVLDPEGHTCRELLEALRDGRISAREFADRLVREYGPDRLARALKALADKLGEGA